MRLKNTKLKIRIHSIEELRRRYEKTIRENKKEKNDEETITARKHYKKYSFMTDLRKVLISRFGVDEFDATDEMVRVVLYGKILKSQNYFTPEEILSFIRENRDSSKSALMKFAKKIYTSAHSRRKRMVVNV